MKRGISMRVACVPIVGAVLLIALAALPQPCFAGKVKTQLAPGTDMARYKTYQWLPTRALTGAGVVENDPVITPLIKDAVNRELNQRGLTEVATGGDLQIAAIVTTHADAQVEAVFMPGPDFYYGT